MARKKKIDENTPPTVEETQKEDQEVFETLNIIRDIMKPKHRLKVCCHRPDMPEVCKVIELPFKPEEGDYICVKPDKATDPDARITLRTIGLIYDYDAGYWVMRPDIIVNMNKRISGEGQITADNIDPLEGR